MKTIVLLFLVAAGCILATGCVGQLKTVTPDIPNVTLVNTSDAIPLSNVSNSSLPSGLKGLLKISIGGWMGEVPASVDNSDVGIVTTRKPLTLMTEEGNHTVEVCCGMQCMHENVTIRFGKQQVVDFSEQLEKNCEFSEPTVRMVDYFMSGNQFTVSAEFINPTTKALSMTAEISWGYSYIESGSHNRVGNSAQGLLYSTLGAGERVTKTISFNVPGGHGYMYETPTVTRVASK